jgi:hypothetical protein
MQTRLSDMISMSRAKINFGCVRSGSLTLKARTKPARVKPGSKAGSAYLVSESSKQLGIYCFGNGDVPDYIDVLFLLEKSWAPPRGSGPAKPSARLHSHSSAKKGPPG